MVHYVVRSTSDGELPDNGDPDSYGCGEPGFIWGDGQGFPPYMPKKHENYGPDNYGHGYGYKKGGST